MQILIIIIMAIWLKDYRIWKACDINHKKSIILEQMVLMSNIFEI